MKTGLLWMLLGATLLLSAPIVSFNAAAQEQDAVSARDISEQSLRRLTNGIPMELDGTSTRASFDFGGRFDQVVTAAELNLRLNTSPVLNGERAQLLIFVNGELANAIRLQPQAEDATALQRKVQLPAHLFANYNQVTFELIDGEVYQQCMAGNATSWVAIDSRSTLRLTTETLPYANDLAYFPEPWFHRSDFNATQVNLLLPEQPQPMLLQSAAVVTSHFAALADWRDVAIETRYFKPPAPNSDADDLGVWPRAHTILLVQDEQWPEGLQRANQDVMEQLPELTQPQLVAMSNPRYPSYKVLVIRAKNETDLLKATQSLAHVGKGFSGTYAELRDPNMGPVQPYQAPNWIRTDRPVTFQELVGSEQDLQRQGYTPDPVRVSLRLPPDLFTWQRGEIPIDLKYRFSPSTESPENQLTVNINDLFVKAFPLRNDEVVADQRKMRIPLVDSSLFADNVVSIPAFKMGLINELQFDFDFAQPTNCLIQPMNNAMGAIDGDSTIDLTGYSHYVALPELSLMAKTGFPYTRMHDLSETTFVVANQPSPEAMSLVLRLAAEFARSTGSATTQLQVTTLDELETQAEQDLVLIGPTVLADWRRRFGDAALQEQLQAQPLAGRERLFDNPERYFENSGPSAAIIAFESPFVPTRTVTVLTATSEAFLERIDAVLSDSQSANNVAGFLTIMTPVQVDSYPAQQQFYVGELSGLTYYAYHLSKYPILVVFLALLLLAVAAVLLRQVFGTIARKRQLGR